jgi:hypothetical protein
MAADNISAVEARSRWRAPVHCSWRCSYGGGTERGSPSVPTSHGDRDDRLRRRLPARDKPPLQVARYQANQYYLPHFDAFDLTTEPGRECVRSGGQRVATVLIYLNNVAQGEKEREGAGRAGGAAVAW